MGWQPYHNLDHRKDVRRAERLRRKEARRLAWLRRRAMTRRGAGYWLAMSLCVAVASSGLYLNPASSPWPASVRLKHVLAAPNCAAARSVGLAHAFREEPGYYLQHDRDRDGIACEPWPR